MADLSKVVTLNPIPTKNVPSLDNPQSKRCLAPWRLCHKSVHGSTGSPRTDDGTRKINHLAVRPELVEGRTADCDTVSQGRGSP